MLNFPNIFGLGDNPSEASANKSEPISIENNATMQLPLIIILGKTGAGKSTLGNLLIYGDPGKETFKICHGPDSGTQDFESCEIVIENRKYLICDTPGFLDTRDMDRTFEVFGRNLQSISEIKAFLLVLELGRMTPEQKSLIACMSTFLGRRAKRNTILVFTHLRKPENMTKNDVVERELHELQRTLLNETGNGSVSYASPAFYKYFGEYFDNNTKRLKTMINDMEPMSEYDIRVHMDPTGAYNVLGQIELKKRIEVLEGKLNDLEYLKKDHAKMKKDFQDFRAEMGPPPQSEKCFDLDTRVLLENNVFIPMKDVSLGDRICSGMRNGKLEFSEVYLITHNEEIAKTEYRKIGYNNGSESGVLRLTALHHIFVNGDRTTDFAHNLIPLKTKILAFNGKELVLATVTNVTTEFRRGYIGMFTRKGTILADNVLCSCYAECKPLQNFIHLVIFLLQLITLLYSSGDSKKLHPYLRILMHMYSLGEVTIESGLAQRLQKALVAVNRIGLNYYIIAIVFAIGLYLLSQ
ncbi:9798_t:CDS:2 [Paraglomus occultum]|uniref:9798_t:CDS:1 n=1 Tax=Paraglomus occultum TaxID=144539 RepID=A0A9N9FNN8_9GLOM|nr:9798_t:CDS:2 [Paraglomus occultum]